MQTLRDWRALGLGQFPPGSSVLCIPRPLYLPLKTRNLKSTRSLSNSAF